MIDLSVCIITRDQSVKLHRCLQELSKFDFEKVILDTGSRDNSIEVAGQFSKNVHEFEWCDDFSAAKNAAISFASHDMIMFLDTDEYLQTFDEKKFLSQEEENRDNIGRIHFFNSYTQDGLEMQFEEWLGRIFDRRIYRYSGKIHEQLTPIFEDREVKYYNSLASVIHDGYDLTKEELQIKADRNRRLLLSEIEKDPSDPYMYYQLGKSEYAVKRYEEAARYCKNALDLSPSFELKYVEDLIESYGYALLNTSRAEQALSELSAFWDNFSNSADFAFLMGLILMNNAKFDEAVNTFVAATRLGESRVRGAGSFMAWYNAGVIREVQGQKKEAKKFYKKCGSYPPAIEGLKRVR